MVVSQAVANRVGFILLGLTNNFAYVIMLSAAYDLLKQTEPTTTSNLKSTTTSNSTEKYCNPQSTSTILLADTLPSLTTKLVYPFILVSIPTAYKAIGTALLSAASFLVTGFTTNQALIFTGVACASFSSGLGESTYLSSTPLYGDVALSGWSIGTGLAGLLGAIVYALLRMVFTIKLIMIIMLIAPILMVVAYFKIIQPNLGTASTGGGCIVAGCPGIVLGHEAAAAAAAAEYQQPVANAQKEDSTGERVDIHSSISHDIARTRVYGSGGIYAGDNSQSNTQQQQRTEQLPSPVQSDGRFCGPQPQLTSSGSKFTFRQKFHYLPVLAKYFMPLLLVYFAEYFINQGLFELIYFPEVSFLDHAAQYRWFQVSYQFGVMISRSSLDFFQIEQLWTMSVLQLFNAALFLAHTTKNIHLPDFYLVIALIVYEGLLGGFTYANTFYRMKKELPPDRQEFGISTVTIADTLGIVFAGGAAIPVHNALCKLYQ